MAESYLVPAGYGEGRYEDRKSKFIGDLYFVESQEQAIELLNEVKAKYRDARHHCYAYIIREGNYMRYSDDGEPQGTAGMPPSSRWKMRASMRSIAMPWCSSPARILC